MSADRREEIPREDWPKLRDLYTPDKSRSYIAYTALENYIRWISIDPAVKHVTIYSLNGDFSDGTFAIIVNNGILTLEFHDRFFLHCFYKLFCTVFISFHRFRFI